MGRVLLAGVAILCAGAAAPQATRIGGHTYAFPPGVFEGGVVETGPVGTVLLEIAWPEMRPLTPAEAAAWPRRDTIRVLANSGAPVAGDQVPDTELAAHIPTLLSAMTELSSGTAARATGHPDLPRPASDTSASGEAVPDAGMKQVETEPPGPNDTVHDVFVREPIGLPKEFIACTRKEQVPYPDCAQSFVALNLILKVSYRRELVPQWRNIEERTLAFLKAHEVHP